MAGGIRAMEQNIWASCVRIETQYYGKLNQQNNDQTVTWNDHDYKRATIG
jgi:hypothetical protein